MKQSQTFIDTARATLKLFPSVDPARVLGIDTSHWTGVVDWQKAKANGIQFAIIKAMDGTIRSKYFAENYRGAKDAGLVVGAYTWLYRNVNVLVKLQASEYARLLKDYPLDILPVVDFEWTKYGGVTSNPNYTDLIDFMSYFGPAMIYTAQSYWQEYGNSSAAWKSSPLWLASYNATPVSVAPWGAGHKFWQFTGNGDGLKYGQPAGSLSADLNYYNGTQADFDNEFGLGETVPPADNVIKITSVKVNNVLVPGMVAVDYTLNGELRLQLVDQRPVIVTPPPPASNLYRVAAEKWSVNHDGMAQPPAGGPLTQPISHSAKKAQFETPLDSGWQAYIRLWNTSNTMSKITDPGFGPSKGYNDKGKLRYIGLVWPGVNWVKVLEIVGDWAHIETISMLTTPPALLKPATHPWLFHKVCDAKGNPVLVQGEYIICPILGDNLWCPMSALTKL